VFVITKCPLTELFATKQPATKQPFVIEKLGVPSEKSTVSFQSRLSRNWLEPFTDEVVIQLAKNGAKRVLVVAPAFVADCLETIVEMKIITIF
jgi:protoheme ferro-lyase